MNFQNCNTDFNFFISIVNSSGSLNATTSAGTGEDLKGDFHFDPKGLPATHLQMRAAIATALGAAGARAKLLADQEERDIEHLMSIIIENQVVDFSQLTLELKLRFLERLDCNLAFFSCIK